MPRPLPQELRERIVAAYEESGETYDDIAERFKVGRASVSRFLTKYRRTGSIGTKPMGGARHPRKVDKEGEELIREHLEAMPDATLGDLVVRFEQERGVKMDPSTMGRSVARMGYTRKRGLFVRRKPSAKTSSNSERGSSQR